MKAKRRIPDYKIISKRGGIPCPRCSQPTQIREHVDEEQLSKPHYSRWYVCTNTRCKTLIMSHEFVVATPAPTLPSSRRQSPPARKPSVAARINTSFDDLGALDPSNPRDQFPGVDMSRPPW
jgi:hypothetical protein